MVVDMMLTGNRYDDTILVGGFLGRTRRQRQIAGIIGHYLIGFVVTGGYLLVLPRLSGPGWARALVYIGAEHGGSFPGVVLDRFHPAVRDGDLPRLANPEYFLLETTRHAAFALALGLTVDKRQSRTGSP